MVIEEMTLNAYVILKQHDNRAYAKLNDDVITDVITNYTDLGWSIKLGDNSRWQEAQHNTRVMVYRTPRLKDLTRYERIYLQRSIGRPTIALPRSSKSIDRFWEFNLTARTGVVSGRYVTYLKTSLAENIIQEMQS